MKIFAYGSNMNINRLRKRVPSAIRLFNASLPGYRFLFNKQSNDGSGKGNIQPSINPLNIVWGVIFEIEETEKPSLDIAEGLGQGYCEGVIDLVDENDRFVQAQVYMADANAINNELLPYDWYKEFVVTGAEQNQLPAEYIEFLKNFRCNVDLDEQRKLRELNILKGL